MPIYQGTSTKNKSEIIINGTPMSKVYVGDRLVWQKPSGVYPVEYGLLYNWPAATDARKITSSDDWVVSRHTPTFDVNSDTNILRNYIGVTGAGGKLKETGLTYWITPNTGATNEVAFNGRGSGSRRYSDGVFINIKTQFLFWSNAAYNATTGIVAGTLQSNVDTFTVSSTGVSTLNKYSGISIRLLYIGVGTPTSYTGNDGKVYRVVTIGTQTWLADNLAETRFRNGDFIPWYGANPANYFTNAEWVALTTAGCCAYNNNVNNVASGFTFPI